MCILFFVCGYQEAQTRRKTWINLFCLCSIAYVLIVCIYSKLHGYPVYNLVYDIINRSEENSPLYALQLVLFTIVWLNNNWQMLWHVLVLDVGQIRIYDVIVSAFVWAFVCEDLYCPEVSETTIAMLRLPLRELNRCKRSFSCCVKHISFAS